MPNWFKLTSAVNAEAVPVATEEDLLYFANRVREAGGANVIEALLPSKASDPKACLIANALNFSCEVRGSGRGDWLQYNSSSGRNVWAMWFPVNMTEEEILIICKKLNCLYDPNRRTMILPEEIGNAAAAFDAGLAFQNYRVVPTIY